MTPIETAGLIAGAVALVVGVPAIVFHRRIATELGHLRNFFTGPRRATRAKPGRKAAR